MGHRVYIDTETGGLHDDQHDLIEVAWAVEDEPIHSLVVPHRWDHLSPKSLEVNGYLERELYDRAKWAHSGEITDFWLDVLKGATLVASNPSFDERFLLAYARQNLKRWIDPWHHRKIDLGTYAMAVWGEREPLGMAKVAYRLGLRAPDHTAAGDVDLLRQCMLALERERGVQE